MFIRAFLILSVLNASDALEEPMFDAPPAGMHGPSEDAGVPLKKTEANALGTTSLHHHEVLRVQRDFGKKGRDVVIDAWTPKSGGPMLEDVRMWWLETSENDMRKPFGKKTLKQLTFGYDQKGDERWEVAFGRGRKLYIFDVVLENGQPAVYGDIDTPDGLVKHCKTHTAKLYAKKMFGKTVGLDRLEVDCVDSSGKAHHGELRRQRR